MQRCMELALKDAQLSPEQVGYVNGHGTATEQGDIAETSQRKPYLGNTIAHKKLFRTYPRCLWCIRVMVLN